MFRVTSPLTCFSLAILTVATTVNLRAQEANSNRPATVEDAARVLDLSTFPLMPGGKSGGPRRLANLGYAAKGDPRAAYAFQQKTLEELGWKALPGGHLSDRFCSGAFGKDGYSVSVSTRPGSGAEAAGLVEIHLTNHGNVDLSKLPVPADAKLVYSFLATTGYVTEKSVKETSETLRKLLMAEGWEPYGTAGDSLYFKKNAIRITVRPVMAPAQGNKTMIQLMSALLSADLPAPADLIEASYADTTKALSILVDMTPEALSAFYRETLGKAGWKPTTEKPVKIDFREMLIFGNDAKDIATLTMHKVDGKLRANLEHQTAAEFAEAVRRVDAGAEIEAPKEKSALRAAMAPKKAARNPVTVSIKVPDEAKGVVREKNQLAFKLNAGKAKAVVETIRADLVEKGWEQALASFEPVVGSVVLRKKGGAHLTIVYDYIAVLDVDRVLISAIGADIEVTGAK